MNIADVKSCSLVAVISVSGAMLPVSSFTFNKKAVTSSKMLLPS